MQTRNGRLIYSASDLNAYLECRHLLALEARVASGEIERPPRSDTFELLAQRGLEHERAHLERLRAERPNLIEIPDAFQGTTSIEDAAAQTSAAMQQGADVIYQATFFDGTFLGRADFLLRTAQPSRCWNWSYEVADTKFALADKPNHIVQLSHYSEHVARVQGSWPDLMWILLANGERRCYRCDSYAAYYRHLKASFLQTVGEPAPYPAPCAHCAQCEWSLRCERRREVDDHLSLVAGIRRDQIALLESAGIRTMTDLANTTNGRPSGMTQAAFSRLHRQAALHVRGRTTGQPQYEFNEYAAEDGFGLLPQPTTGDVFFDMEGDPLFEIGLGLEYLFGCYSPDDEPAFRAFWGTDRNGEKHAFEQLVDFLTERRRKFPSMHVYHYAPYEKIALRRLAQRHATREDEVDNLLRGEVLVDLFAVVRQALVISQPRYSIKSLEPFYGMLRSAQIRRGDDSVIQFETWLQQPQRVEILQNIERYNEEDCRSTQRLRDWLLERRGEYMAARDIHLPFKPETSPGLCHVDPVDGCKKCADRACAARELARVSETERDLRARERDSCARLLADLLNYHRREERPAWWEVFDRCENVDRLVEFDNEAIGGLELCEDVEPYKRSKSDRNLVYTYRFPPQQYHLDDHPWDPRTRKVAGEIVALDDAADRLELKRGGTLDDARRVTALIPGGPYRSDPQKDALARIALQYIHGTLRDEHPVVLDVLDRAYPRLRRTPAGSAIQPPEVSPGSVGAVAHALDRSYLVVQGPPGSGKTYTGARLIVSLLAAGKRIGVMAHSHKAIHHVLREIETVVHGTAAESSLRGMHKHSSSNAGSSYESVLAQPLIASADDNTEAESDVYNLVSGNAWLFARPGMSGRFDYLFVDEAGQVSLADAIAVSPSARSVVFLGDPMQLAQVSQGVHPAGAGASVLEHLLGDNATIPPDRGILLDTSYRMHPDICSFISHAVYNGRLRAAPSTQGNRVTSAGLSGSGLRYLPVEHAANVRESLEEAQRIVAEIGHLLHGTVMRHDESARKMRESDILVVTPYNAQREKIAWALDRGGYGAVRVGTVDKFQGQEAPVVFYSMATSSGEDLPRSMEFLFEKNRFNVAVSRAQCLSVLVCSPRLLDLRCRSVAQIELIDLLCRFVEQAR
jgi:predicted RecB family nuclease